MQAIKSKFAKILNISITKESVLPYVAAPVLFLLILLICQHLRPIGIFFLAVFFYWIYNTRCNYRIVPPPELQQKFKEYLKRIEDFRTQHKTCTMCFYIGSLCSLIFFGHVVVITVIFIFIYLIGIKYIHRFTLEEDKISTYRDVRYSELHTSRDNEDDASVSGSETDDEFLPEKNSRNIILLDRACRDFTLHTAPTTENTEDTEDEEDKSDDIPSELLINDSIPELNENSTDDEDELMPLIDAEKLSSVVEPSTSAGAKIHFQKSHFKSDSTLAISSSSSEESLSKGLKFPDAETMVVDSAKSHDSHGESSTSMMKSAKIELPPQGSNLVPAALINNYDSIRNAIKAAVIVATQESPDDVSSESEFEFLGYE